MQAFHSDAHSLALPPGHSFPASKYRLLREHFEAEPGLLRMAPAPAASEAELCLVHTPEYVNAVLQGQLSAAQQREIGFPWSPSMAARSLHSVGASIAAARAALAEGVAANMAGGTHHAFADRGSGYCVFNDVAVAARLMQQEWSAQAGPGDSRLRVLVIDLDVHQGNGTAAIFEGDDSVFTFSMHGAKNFPARKERSDLDVELPDGCSDEPYLQALDQALEEIWARHASAGAMPGLAFYLAGADPHEGDRLGRLKLSSAGLLERDRRVLSALRERGIPVALSMAGGYGHDIATTVAVQANTLNEAVRAWAAWRLR
ncbi:histone deacetylase family protein [Kinneretia aquatilis]|uniref:histone deacetylase family protein n=1 Tax=Kinneretia aquatilis TaxID=2070761 RepID=UPI001495418D|nr:histone deacetylase [Paucibacter aquatile]WIV99057.1 histone deacetylase [Paucibacter aquatile]